MERFIKTTLAGLAAVVAVTGFVFATAPVATSSGDAATEEVAIKRDEDDVELELARLDEDDDGGDDELATGAEFAAAGNGDISRSRDRSRDVTSADRSKSRDKSRDRTGDRVGVADRSKSLDRSRDRTGDHDSRDISRSRDASRDDTSVSFSNSNSNSFA